MYKINLLCTNCLLIVVSKPQDPINHCVPSPCGPYSECRVTSNTYTCSCLPNYRGSPPHCRPECVSNSDCSYNLACINMKCKDPCEGSCGLNSECHVFNHIPQCACLQGYVGNPFVSCYIQQVQCKHDSWFYYIFHNMFLISNFIYYSKLRNYTRHNSFSNNYYKLDVKYRYLLNISVLLSLSISQLIKFSVLQSTFILYFK